MKKISIIVSVYKAEKYLKQCLGSIVNQTYSNLEILLVDDGSPDSCGEICDTYAKVDKRIKVIHQGKAGLSEARNIGLSQATGEYFLFVDSDDWLELDLCEMAVADMEAKNADILVFGYYLTSKEGEIRGLEVCHCGKSLSGEESVKALIKQEIKDYAWNKLYKREVFRRDILLKESIFEDVGNMGNVFGNAKKVYITNRALYFYRQTGGRCSVDMLLKNQIEYKNIWHRRLFEVYYTLGFHKWTKLHQFLRNVALSLMFLRQEPLELSELSGKGRCFLIGTPDHDNLGDHAIGIAEVEFLEKYLPDYDLVIISEERYKRVRNALKKKCNSSDIIILNGGGNLGDTYLWCEKIREDVLKTFRKQKILLFPQTVHFSDTEMGKRMEKKARRVYQKSEVVLMAREAYSFIKMKQLFPKNQSYLVPDIVLLMEAAWTNEERQGLLLCLRRDVECALDWEQRKHIYSTCKKVDKDVRYTDTTTGMRYDETTGRVAVQEKLKQFSRSRLVVTDRLHGMIFAALTGTPCVVLSNYNKKVKGVYQWIADLNYIEFLENVDELERAVQHLLGLQQKDEYPGKWLQEQYKEIERRLEEWNRV